jgi:mitochondrial fission protein ELM1
MKSLADALGWPYETKQLVYNRRSAVPNLLLGASLIGIDRNESNRLEPPWPDVVIAGSRRSAPVARWIKAQSGGRARLVHLMHTQAPLSCFDLVITTPQYCLPRRANVLHNTVPLNYIGTDRRTAAASEWAPGVAHLPRPFIALLVGGNSSTHRFDVESASRLGRQASAEASAAGGSLLISTSPRTPSDSAEALFAAIDCPAYRYSWRPSDDRNPYVAFLGLADRFIVTSDSASLPTDACATGKPVWVFDLPQRPKSGAKEFIRRWGKRRGDSTAPPQSPADRLYDGLVYLGLLKPARDFAKFHDNLRQRGLVTAPGDTAGRNPPALDDMERSVRAIRELVMADRTLVLGDQAGNLAVGRPGSGKV